MADRAPAPALKYEVDQARAIVGSGESSAVLRAAKALEMVEAWLGGTPSGSAWVDDGLVSRDALLVEIKVVLAALRAAGRGETP